MTELIALGPGRDRSATGAMLIAGIVLATLTDAVASTVLSLGRGYIIGDTHATPDEFAWLDIGYTASKLIGFLAASTMMQRVDSRRLVIYSTLVMGAACGMTLLTTRLDVLIALRMTQGLSAAVLLVAGQTMVFAAYPRTRQPMLQALFAMGSVVAPATIAPALQGWLIDSRSWSWIFFGVIPVSLAAAGLLLIADGPKVPRPVCRPVDWIGLALISVSAFCLTYVLNQGSRRDWFGESAVLWSAVIGAAALLAFLGEQVLANGAGLFDFSVFRGEDFCFAFVVSFVAGAALFGSAFLIPSFAVSVLAFRPTDAGLLLLPSGAFFIAMLLVAAFLMQVRRVPPVATVPFGILMIMVAMWMLSGSTRESGADDMMSAILLRGLGLGFLFLSINLIAFGDLDKYNRAAGIGLFNTGRLLGGLIGVAGLETLIEHDIVGNLTVLGANVASGAPAVGERLTTTTAMLASRGMDTMAGSAAISVLDRAVIGQSSVIAFDTAFNAVALLFLFAAPVLVSFKIVLHRFMHAAQRPPIEQPHMFPVAIPVVDDRSAAPRPSSASLHQLEHDHEGTFALDHCCRLSDRHEIGRRSAVSL